MTEEGYIDENYNSTSHGQCQNLPPKSHAQGGTPASLAGGLYFGVSGHLHAAAHTQK